MDEEDLYYAILTFCSCVWNNNFLTVSYSNMIKITKNIFPLSCGKSFILLKNYYTMRAINFRVCKKAFWCLFSVNMMSLAPAMLDLMAMNKRHLKRTIVFMSRDVQVVLLVLGPISYYSAFKRKSSSKFGINALQANYVRFAGNMQY
jgi:hypothetical protein